MEEEVDRDDTAMEALDVPDLPETPAETIERLTRELEQAKRERVGDWATQRDNDALTIEKYEWKDRAERAEARLLAALPREPVAWLVQINSHGRIYQQTRYTAQDAAQEANAKGGRIIPLYAAPPAGDDNG